MSITLDVVIDSPPDHSVDMKASLDSMQGVSDATRLIAEAVLTGNTPHRLSHKGKVRTSLKQSFKGSYGHVFALDIHDGSLLSKFNRIGKSVFAELISYYLRESLYQESQQLTEKAQAIVDRLDATSEELVKQLRVSALTNIHEVSIKFNHDLKLRYRRSRDSQTILAKFDRSTAKILEAEESAEEVRLTAHITRLNINTGNGRLLVKGENETVAFGFGIEYKAVNIKAKKLFSENLDFNNGLDDKDWKFLNISALPIKLHDGKIIKYIVKGIYND